jgi:uncharacterized protein
MTSELLTDPLLLAVVGVLVGLLGTLVGAGGGFILLPFLALVMPDAPADQITAISMAVVFFNALSGTLAYARMKRIDFASGRQFALCAIPGAILGAVATAYVTRRFFDHIVGTCLIAGGLLLLWNSFRGAEIQRQRAVGDRPFILDEKGKRTGSIMSAGVGFISSLIGIGGGIIHVPALVYVLGYPVHVATATSHFVLTCTSFTAMLEHVFHGSYQGNVTQSLILAAGAVFGAQGGARLSHKVKGPTIVRVLAIALALAGTRIIFTSH